MFNICGRALNKQTNKQVILPLIHLLLSSTGGQPDITCKLPEGATKNESIPLDDKGKFSQCLMYKDVSSGNETIDCNDGYEYGGTRGPTIVTEVSAAARQIFLWLILFA